MAYVHKEPIRQLLAPHYLGIFTGLGCTIEKAELDALANGEKLEGTGTCRKCGCTTFWFNTETGRWRCRGGGCGDRGGDVFEFLENEARRRLGQRGKLNFQRTLVASLQLLLEAQPDHALPEDLQQLVEKAAPLERREVATATRRTSSAVPRQERRETASTRPAESGKPAAGRPRPDYAILDLLKEKPHSTRELLRRIPLRWGTVLDALRLLGDHHWIERKKLPGSQGEGLWAITDFARECCQ